MPGDAVRFGDEDFERLYELWIKGKRGAGWIVVGSEQFRVIGNFNADKEDTVFVKVSSIDDMYGSLTGGLTG